MTKINFIEFSGAEHSIDVDNGNTVMEAAIQNNVPGIDPETNQYGVGNALGLDYFTNPQTKSVLFTAAFNF